MVKGNKTDRNVGMISLLLSIALFCIIPLYLANISSYWNWGYIVAVIALLFGISNIAMYLNPV